MEKSIIIKPLLPLIEGDRDVIKRNDLLQVAAKVKNALKKKEKNTNPIHAGSGYIERKYLSIIKKTLNLMDENKISKKELIAIVNEILNEQNFNYLAASHRPAHDNYLLNTLVDFKLSGIPRKKNRNNYSKNCYDLAFYNKLSKKSRESHHQIQDSTGAKKKNLKSVFYMRCEEYSDDKRVLFGNMQIDDKDKYSWRPENTGKIMLMNKNINLAMIQQAVAHSLENGKTRIVFQGGDAALYSQGIKVKHKNISVMITEKNINKYREIYEKELKKI